jgi:DNA ligase-associated metallophosphoesterase
MEFIAAGKKLELLPEKCVWIQNERLLVIADVHLGKATHFRRSGVAVPDQVNDKNTEALITLLQQRKPERILFLGDLFHSVYNNEWEVFGQVRKAFAHCSFELVIGNHDILSAHQYERHNIKIYPTRYDLGDLIFTHDLIEEVPEGKFNISGHIHPGVHLQGTARQSMTLPCFYFKKNQAIIPAFGSFTGLARIRPSKGEKVFVIADGKILDVSESY